MEDILSNIRNPPMEFLESEHDFASISAAAPLRILGGAVNRGDPGSLRSEVQFSAGECGSR